MFFNFIIYKRVRDRILKKAVLIRAFRCPFNIMFPIKERIVRIIVLEDSWVVVPCPGLPWPPWGENKMRKSVRHSQV